MADDLAAQLHPGGARAAKPLQHEPLAAEDAGAQRALQRHGQLHALRRAQEPMAMHEIAAPRLHLDRHDLSRHLGGKGHRALPARRR